MIIDENDEVNYVQNEKERKYKIYIIADASGTSPIVIYDELLNHINIKDTYIFTQIKKKRIHDNIIFTTNSNSTILKTNVVSNICMHRSVLIFSSENLFR